MIGGSNRLIVGVRGTSRTFIRAEVPPLVTSGFVSSASTKCVGVTAWTPNEPSEVFLKKSARKALVKVTRNVLLPAYETGRSVDSLTTLPEAVRRNQSPRR